MGGGVLSAYSGALILIILFNYETPLRAAHECTAYSCDDGRHLIAGSS